MSACAMEVVGRRSSVVADRPAGSVWALAGRVGFLPKNEDRRPKTAPEVRP